MGWRYRKRIKIIPGIYINISKSGISTNVGVRGANVTFGSKGTYVNTGVPGTGLYRRDKVHGDNGRYDSIEGHQKDKIVYENNLFKSKEYDENTYILIYHPTHYIFYFFSLFFPIGALGWYLNGFEMLYSCLINATFQLILCFAIMANMSINEENSAYKIKLIEDTTISTIKREIVGHVVRCILKVVIIILNLFPLFSMNGTFVRVLRGYEMTWNGGVIEFLITILIVSCWTRAFIKEKKFISPLKKAIKLKQKNTRGTNDDICSRNQQSMLQTSKTNYHEQKIAESYGNAPESSGESSGTGSLIRNP